MSEESNLAIIVLAAGKGTRMKSTRTKVLHHVAGRSMLKHILATAESLNPQKILVVAATGQTDVIAEAQPYPVVIQAEQLGTGHAVQCTQNALKGFKGDLLILYGDHPVIQVETLKEMITERRSGAAVVVLGFTPDDPLRYGRLVVHNGHLEAIVEYKDTTPAQREIRLCNSGMMCVDSQHLFHFLSKITNKNAAGEYYLTDLVGIARKEGLLCSVVEGNPNELAGCNSRKELAYLEQVVQTRLREKAMDNGATLIDPNNTFFAYDTAVGQDVIIEPGVFMGPGVTIHDRAYIETSCRLEKTTIAEGERVKAFTQRR